MVLKYQGDADRAREKLHELLPHDLAGEHG